MFIAVRPLKNEQTDKVLVFDTKDLTLVPVDKTDLMNSVVNHNNNTYINNEILVGLTETFDYKYKKHGMFSAVSDSYDLFTLSTNGFSKLDNLYIRTSLKWKFASTPLVCRLTRLAPLGYDFYVNNKYIEHVYNLNFDIRLHYAFFCMNMLIARFTLESEDNYITVVLNKNGALLAVYDLKSVWYGDEGVRTRVEMLTQY